MLCLTLLWFIFCRICVKCVVLLSQPSFWAEGWLKWSSLAKMMLKRPTGGTTRGISMVSVCSVCVSYVYCTPYVTRYAHGLQTRH